MGRPSTLQRCRFTCIYTTINDVIYMREYPQRYLTISLYSASDHGWCIYKLEGNTYCCLQLLRKPVYLVQTWYLNISLTLWHTLTLLFPYLSPPYNTHTLLDTGEASGPAGNSWDIHSWRPHYKTAGKKEDLHVWRQTSPWLDLCTVCICHNLTKECPWAEHLTRLPKRRVDTLLSVSAITL